MNDRAELWQKLANLSPDKHELLLKRLRNQGWPVPLRAEHASEELTYEPDLMAEAYLDPTLKLNGTAEIVTNPRHIFLTGATGFLGAFLLSDILKNSQAKVHCLVRAADANAARKRVEDNLQKYNVPLTFDRERIIGIPGDLGNPLFGLSPADFDALADKVEVVYHNGALMKFIYAYDSFIGANVVGTQEALRLAMRGRPKPFHYVSTCIFFMFAQHAERGSEAIKEAGSADLGKYALGGYGQSKWVAEKLVSIAQSRGLLSTIYRCGMIIGHSETGAYADDEAWGRMIKAGIDLKGHSSVPVPMYTTPVDYAAKAISALSRMEAAAGKTFHLIHDEPMSLFPWEELRARGYAVEPLNHDVWKNKHENNLKDGTNTALTSLWPFFNADWRGAVNDTMHIFGKVPKIVASEAPALLGDAIRCAPLSKAIDACLERMVEIDWIPRPPRA